MNGDVGRVRAWQGVLYGAICLNRNRRELGPEDQEIQEDDGEHAAVEEEADEGHHDDVGGSLLHAAKEPGEAQHKAADDERHSGAIDQALHGGACARDRLGCFRLLGSRLGKLGRCYLKEGALQREADERGDDGNARRPARPTGRHGRLFSFAAARPAHGDIKTRERRNQHGGDG